MGIREDVYYTIPENRGFVTPDGAVLLTVEEVIDDMLFAGFIGFDVIHFRYRLRLRLRLRFR